MRSIATNASLRFVRAMWLRTFDDQSRSSGLDGSWPRSADLEWLQQENARLSRAVDELVLLDELAKEIGGTPDSTRILKKITSRARRFVRAEQSAIYLIDTGDPGTKTLVRVASDPDNRLRVHLQDSVVGLMGLHRETLLVDDCRCRSSTSHRMDQGRVSQPGSAGKSAGARGPVCGGAAPHADEGRGSSSLGDRQQIPEAGRHTLEQ